MFHSQTIATPVGKIFVMSDKPKHDRTISQPRVVAETKHMSSFKRKPFTSLRCQSVMIKRRNWSTSARHQDVDSPLNLSKQNFGQEYLEVLDKLTQPKLPDNREMKGDPAYEYAQKAQKKRRLKKSVVTRDLIKCVQRKTKATYIRNLITVMQEHKRKKFSLLEVDMNLYD